MKSSRLFSITFRGSVLIALAGGSLFLQSCETPGQNAAAGAAVGAAAGAIIGNQSGNAAEGALIGGAAGGAVGYGAGKAKENRQRRTYYGY